MRLRKNRIRSLSMTMCRWNIYSWWVYSPIHQLLCFRPTLQWPSSCEGEDQIWSSNEVHNKQSPQHLPRTATTGSSQGQGSYTVLPPIGKPTAGKGPKMCSGQSVNSINSVPGSSSDSYLVQMEKLKQLKARGSNKVGAVCELHLCPVTCVFL